MDIKVSQDNLKDGYSAFILIKDYK